MSVHILFPTLVFEETLEDLQKHNERLIDKAYTAKMPYRPEQDKDPVVLQLIQLLGNKTIAFSRNWGVPFKKIACQDFQIKVVPPGESQEYCNHSGSDFSVLYYLQTSKGCGDVVFKNPSDVFDTPPLSASGAGSFSFEPEENKLLIFRSSLRYKIAQNKSNRDWICFKVSYTCRTD